MHNKIPLIYIMSASRSGSTTLSVLLGAHEDICNLGEMQFWGNVLSNNKLVYGGVEASKCPFLSEISQKLRSEGELGFEGILERGQIKYEKRLGFLRMISDRFFKNKALQDYQQKIAETCRLAMEKSNTRFVVDSSKNPARWLLLKQSGLFDLYTIWLVRDPRGFCHSCMKGHSVQSTFFFNNLILLKYYLRWLYFNCIILFLWPGEKKKLILFYESFFKIHDEVRLLFKGFLKIDHTQIANRLKAQQPFSTAFIIAGNNGVRLKKEVVIKPDFTWKNSLSPRQSSIISAYSYLFLLLIRWLKQRVESALGQDAVI